ncbi:hypothetical protein C0J52_14317, partial [Blattella germanica]
LGTPTNKHTLFTRQETGSDDTPQNTDKDHRETSSMQTGSMCTSATAELCSTCHKTITDDDCSVECEGCHLWSHRKCSMTQGEFDTLKRTNCKLTWLCDHCKPKILNLESTGEKMTQISEEVDFILKYITSPDNTLEERIRNTIITEVAKMKDRPTVIVEKTNNLKEKEKTPPSSKKMPTKPEGTKPTKTQEARSRERTAEPERRWTSEGIIHHKAMQQEEEEAAQPVERTWVDAINRRRRSQQQTESNIYGAATEERSLRAGTRTAWLYVGRLHHATTERDKNAYLCRVSERVEVEQLDTKGSNKAFKISVMVWNIEGLRSMKNSMPYSIFTDDIIILTETFLTEEENISSYYNYHALARQGDKGRPSGGIACLIKPWLAPAKVLQRTPNLITIKCKHLSIISGYFQPEWSAIDIIESLSEALATIEPHEPVLIAGDFNCRTDVSNAKSTMTIDYLEQERFTLVNNPKEPTYISHNGMSTIDIIFLNAHARAHSVITLNNTAIAPLRKYIPVRVTINVTRGKVLNKTTTTKIKRNLNQEQIAKSTAILEAAKNSIQNGDIEETSNEAEKEVEAATADSYLALRPKRPTFTQTIGIDVLKEHLHNFLNKENKVTAYPVEIIAIQKFPEITEEEIVTAIYSLKQKKTAGPDHIYNEHIKATHPLLIDLWVRLFNKCIELNNIPEQWRTSIVKILYKGKGDISLPDSYRGIALESNLFKSFTKILTNRIIALTDHLIAKEQMGFRKGRSTLQAITNLMGSIEEALRHPKGNLYVLFVDNIKAFDMINRQKLINTIENSLGKKPLSDEHH